MEFEAALAQEALGVFGRTGLTPSQLADGLTECKELRQSWVDAYTKMRDTLKRIADQMTVAELKANDQYDDADFEGGYDTIIDIARTAMEN